MFSRARPAAPKQQQQQLPPGVSPGRPLHLVQEHHGKFSVGEEALDCLRAIDGPVGVVAVCGRARQGKSFILNALLGRCNGFVVGPTHRPCTKGLWIWSSPIECVAADGTKFHLVLLDSEGIDAYDQTSQYSTQVFSLAVLLSSVFVYNQMGGIDEAALDRLSLVTEMTQHIRVKANTAAGTAAELGRFSPSFIWLLRDFYLDLAEGDGRRITPRDYLELALAPATASAGPAAAGKNSIRASIRGLFPDRECFTLVRPVNDEAELQHLESLPPTSMRPEFRTGLSALTDHVIGRAGPKLIDGVAVRGRMLAGLATAYVAAINAGAVPTIATAWQACADGECRRAADAGLAAAVVALDAAIAALGGAADDAGLVAAEKAALVAASAAFDAAAVGDDATRRAHSGAMAAAVGARCADRRAALVSAAAAAADAALAAHTATLATTARSPHVTPESLSSAITACCADYESRITGPAKWAKLATWLRGPCTLGLLTHAATTSIAAAADRAQRAEATAAAAAAEASRAAATAAAAVAEAADARRSAARSQEEARAAEAARRVAEGAAMEATAARARHEATAAEAARAAAAASAEAEGARGEIARAAGGAAAAAAAARQARATADAETGGRRAAETTLAAERAAMAAAVAAAAGREQRASREAEALRARLADAERTIAAQDAALVAAQARADAAAARAAAAAAAMPPGSAARRLQADRAREAVPTAGGGSYSPQGDDGGMGDEPPRALAGAFAAAAPAAKRPRAVGAAGASNENARSAVNGADLTVQQLRAALTEEGLVEELCGLGPKPKKAELVALYERNRA